MPAPNESAQPSNDEKERRQVILTDQGTGTSEAKSTHAVDIFAFVEAQEIPYHYFETPYYLAPAPGGEKAYALLRETLRRTRKIGIAYVVIQMRRHLAALVPHGKALVLNTLRCASEASRFDALCEAPQSIAEADISEGELAAATRLVDSMTQQWETLRSETDVQLASPAPVQAPADKTAEVIELEELLDLAEPDGFGFDDEFMDKLWGRPHRRPSQYSSRRACTAAPAQPRHIGPRGRARRRPY